jgi:hypothetical protein
MNSTPYQGTITLDEYVTAQKILSFRRRLWYRGIIALAGLYCLYRALSAEQIDFFYGSLAVYFIVVLLVLSPIILRRRFRKQYTSYKRIHDEIKGYMDEEGIHTYDDRDQPALTNWSRFIKFQSKDGLLLIHLNELLAIILPHRFFNEPDLASAQELLAKKLGK